MGICLHLSLVRSYVHVVTRIIPYDLKVLSGSPPREFPLYIDNLPKCRNPMSEKPDTPGGVALDIKQSQITCVHAMWTHTSFWAIPTLRGASFDETLVLMTVRSTPLTSPRRGYPGGHMPPFELG